MLRELMRMSARPIKNLAGRMGIDIQEVHGLSHQIRKLQSITDLETKLSATEKLVRNHPLHPMAHLELANCYHMISDEREFKQMDRYAQVRKEWLLNTGLEELNIEFIFPGMVIGAVGNHFQIENVIKANRYGLRSSKKLFLLLNENVKLRNPALFEYFEPELFLIREKETIQALKILEAMLTIPLGFFIPLNDGCPFLDIAANQVEKEREKLGIKDPFLLLSDHHREMGLQALKKLGLPEDAWYVTLHVREPGYRGETHKDSREKWRNSNPLDYIKSIEAVTKAGGWVFRMGDPSMTPLPKMSQVIDYANNEIRCDWMDVFLGATCRFLIGTGSGYFHIPAFFGVPCIMTNFPGFAPYYGMKSHDLYLPRWLKSFKTKKLVTFEDYMSPPTSMLWRMKSFKDKGLYWLENTPEELEAVTQEMLERTIGATPLDIPEDDLQRRFKDAAAACGLKHGGHPVKAFAPISRDFLSRNLDLL